MCWQRNLSASYAMGMSLFFACNLGLLRIRFSHVIPSRVFLQAAGGLGGSELGVGRMAHGRDRRVHAEPFRSRAALAVGLATAWSCQCRPHQQAHGRGVLGPGGREPARCCRRVGEDQPRGASGDTCDPKKGAARCSQSGIIKEGRNSMTTQEVVRGAGGGDLSRVSSLCWMQITLQ